MRTWYRHLIYIDPTLLESVIQSGFSFYKFLHIRNGGTHVPNKTARRREGSF